MIYKSSILISGSKTNKPKLRWKIVKKFPMYKVSENGDVIHVKKGKLLKQFINGSYYSVNLYKNKKMVKKKIHVLVAEAFIPNPNNLPIPDHIDNNRLNNKVSNLRWYTRSDNSLSYHKNFKPKRAIIQYDLKYNKISKWDCLNDILEHNKNYKKSTISMSLYSTNKKNISAYGFIWKYEKRIKKEIKLKDNEIFKSIGNFEGKNLSDYKVSNYGNVWSNIKNKLLKPHIHQKYYTINLIDKNTNKQYKLKINRLVAYIFIPNDDPINKIFVNHIDENKLNNYYKNLEWITPRNNALHSLSKPIEMIDIKTNKILRTFKCAGDAMKFLKIQKHSASIRYVCQGKQKTAYGYKWRYIEKNIFDFTIDEMNEIDHFDIYEI